MGPAIYLIAILGCGEGDAPCEEISVAQPRYESRAACVAATEATLLRNSDHPYPIVVAQCREAGTAADPLMPAEVALPIAESGPAARPASAPRRLASR